MSGDHPDVLVVGAGVAGLVAAGLLARSGRGVLLLEGHDKPGGSASWYEKSGFTLDAGATTLIGLEAGGPFARILEALGIRPGGALTADPVAGVSVEVGREALFLGRDPEAFAAEVRRALPGAGPFFERVRRDADALWEVTRRLPRLPLATPGDLLSARRLLGAPLLRLLPTAASTVSDVARAERAPRTSLFAQILDLSLRITVQSPADVAPWWSGALGIDLFRRGVSRPRGGMRSLATALEGAARDAGTEVRYRTAVRSLRRHGGGWAARTASGEEVRAKAVVAALPLQELPGLLREDPEAASAAVRAGRRSEAGWGAVVLNLGLSRVVHEGRAKLHRLVLRDPGLPPGDGNSVFVSYSPPGDPVAPPGGQTVSLSTHTRPQRWEALRGEEYRAAKAALRERMLAPLLAETPGLSGAIAWEDLGTPRTFRRFVRRASVGGLPLSLARSGLLAPDPTLGLPGFQVAGDTVFPGPGTLSVALSGLLAAERLGAVTVGGNGRIRTGAR